MSVLIIVHLIENAWSASNRTGCPALKLNILAKGWPAPPFGSNLSTSARVEDRFDCDRSDARATIAFLAMFLRRLFITSTCRIAVAARTTFGSSKGERSNLKKAVLWATSNCPCDQLPSDAGTSRSFPCSAHWNAPDHLPTQSRGRRARNIFYEPFQVRYLQNRGRAS